jgi:hypothetical protein
MRGVKKKGEGVKREKRFYVGRRQRIELVRQKTGAQVRYNNKRQWEEFVGFKFLGELSRDLPRIRFTGGYAPNQGTGVHLIKVER